jgi:hypothetical protein
MRPSTSTLSEMLVAFGAAVRPFTAKQTGMSKDVMSKGFSIGNETYGKDSRLYIGCPDVPTRRKLESFLELKGVTTVDRGYWQGSAITEVGVTYFKGYHWDE